MQVSYRTYPHPVLSYFSDDYLRCHYQTNISTTVSRNSYAFSVISKTSSRSLLSLLASGDALHAVHVECAATRFRKLYKSGVDEFNIEISAEQLDGRVELCSFIIASKNIDEYFSEEFHSDFGGRKFRIRKGDILAVEKDRVFVAEKEHDPLRKLPSIFTIRANPIENAPPIDLDSSGNKVVIQLSHELHTIYKKLSSDRAMTQILSSMIIVPALISLLEIINSGLSVNNISEIEERRWFMVLANKLKELGYKLNSGEFADSSLLIAQKLIGAPLSQALPRLVAISEDSGEE